MPKDEPDEARRAHEWMEARGDAPTGSPPAPSHSIELHIEELVLHNFAPEDRYRLGEAVEHELKRLLTEQGMPAGLIRSGDVEHLESATVNLRTDATSETSGAQIAQAIYGGFKQ